MVAALTETVKNIDEMIQSPGSAARERLETAALHEKQYDTLRAGGVRCGFRAPAMMDAQGQLNAIPSSADPRPTTPRGRRAPSNSSATSSRAPT